jgi:hypothetical protein
MLVVGYGCDGVFSVLQLGIWVQLSREGVKLLFYVTETQVGFTLFAEMTLGELIEQKSATRDVRHSRYGLVLPALVKNARQGSMPLIHQSLQFKQFHSVKLYWPNWSILSSGLYFVRQKYFIKNILLKADFQIFF